MTSTLLAQSPQRLAKPVTQVSEKLLQMQQEEEQRRLSLMRQSFTEALQKVTEGLQLPSLARIGEVLASHAQRTEDQQQLVVAKLDETASHQETAARVAQSTRRMIGSLLVGTLLLAAFSMVMISVIVFFPELLPNTAVSMVTKTVPISASPEGMQTLQVEIATLREQKMSLTKENDTLKRQATELNSELAATSQSLITLGQARQQAQAEISKLQQIQHAFQFRLLPGKDGAVFAEIAPDATPFQHEGKTYVALTNNAAPQL